MSQAGPQNNGSCGPPHYCARTDWQIVPYPPAPPAPGPAGSIITDPGFGSRILRATDASTDPKHPGLPYHTPGNADQNAWNKTDTSFFVGDTGGGTSLFSFDPAAMSVHSKGRLISRWRGDPEFSFVNPNILYGITGRNPAFQQYDLAFHQFATVNEAGSCVKLNGSDTAYSLFVSADDQRLSMVIGPEQDKNYLVYVYDRKQGCRWYNTQTGEVGGQWGPAGTIPAPYRYMIHSAELSKSGDFVDIGSQQIGGLLIWEVGTLNVSRCAQNPVDHCGGHSSLGYSHLLDSANSHHPLDFIKRPLNSLQTMTYLVKGLPSPKDWYDYHTSWNYIDPQDDTPVCFSTYNPRNSDTPTPLKVNGPWENEIDCLETDGKASSVWRFAHTYSTARNGFWSSPRGNISQDGRFFMFSSDWEDQLGRDPHAPRYRTDVFVVQLR